MTDLRRRSLLTAALAVPPVLALGAGQARAADGQTFRIGYQKASVSLSLAKTQGVFEKRLATQGWQVSWAEFTSGPPMLEALAANAVDFAYTGEPPVIFAQAAGAKLVYAAATQPSPKAIGILIPPGSTVTSVAQLKGKTVAVAKGSSAHFLLVSALAHAGVDYKDVNKVFLQPADARAAFTRGAVDAWSIWDPFYAGAQAAGAKLLTDGTGLMQNRSYYTAGRAFSSAHPDVLKTAISVINDVEAWEKQNQDEAAAAVAPSIGLPPAVIKIWFARQKYGVGPLTPEIFAGQQQIADAFYKLNLIPSPIKVTDDAWTAS